jgi:adenylate cyclase
LRAHDTLVRDAVAAHGGTVVKSAGDGYMIVFSDAKAAVACAVALQRGHEDHDFGLDVGTVRVRMGSHVGEVIREGDDFFGRTVILAARVAAQAAGGEVLVSDTVAVSVGDLADRGIKFGPPRGVELKGIRGTQTVHPLEW